jgi:hypothetical protein
MMVPLMVSRPPAGRYRPPPDADPDDAALLANVELMTVNKLLWL